MRLRSIIILNLLILFILYTGIIYFLPPYIIKKDIGHASEQLQTALVTNTEHILNAQGYLFSQLMSDFQQVLENNLAFLNREPSLFSTAGIWNPWEDMVKILSRHSDMEFIEIHHLDPPQSATLMPDEGSLHLGTVVEQDETIWVVDSQGKKWPSVVLPTQGTISYYLLLPQGKEGLRVRQGVDAILSTDQTSRHEHATPQNNQNQLLEVWQKKQQLISQLAPYLGTPYGQEIVGIAAKTNDQLTILYTAEIMRWSPLVPPKSIPIRKGEVETDMFSTPFFIAGPQITHLYFARTLFGNTFQATVAIPINKIVQEMALFAHANIWMMVNPSLWIGYHSDGSLCTAQEQENFQYRLSAYSLEPHTIPLFSRNNQELQLGEDTYFYNRIAVIPGAEMAIFSQVGGVGSMEEVAGRAANVLVRHLSDRLFLVFSIFGIGLVIFIFTRATYITIRPVNALSTAAQQVTTGRYDAVQLPDLGKRKDEIAQLVFTFGEMTRGLKEKEQIRAVLDKVVSKEIATEILKSNIHLGGEDRRVSILFADIRDFTHMTGLMSPQEVIHMLNRCMTKLTSVVEGEGGVIDKYVGDCIMAIYGAPTDYRDHALNAVSSGLLMLQKMKEWNNQRIAQGELPLEVGIGVNTGVVVAGNMGAEDRLNYTVLGAPVNLAARLCDVAEAGQLWIGEGTYSAPGVQEAFHIESLGEKMLKGFVKPVNVYRVIDFNWTADQGHGL